MHITLVPISLTETCQQCIDQAKARHTSTQQEGRKQVAQKAAKANQRIKSKFANVRPTARSGAPEEHVLVGHCCHSPVGQHLDEHVHPSPRERMLLKDLFTSFLDVVLDRQVLFAERPASVVSLPSLMLQLERICIACTLHALRKRVKAAKALQESSSHLGEVDMLKDQVKDGLHYFVSEAKTVFTGLRTEEEVDDEISLEGVDASLMKKPVSVEEIHLAMYELMPKVTDTQNDESSVFLARLVHNNKHLIDQVSHVSWLFTPAAHKQVAEKRSACFEVPTTEQDRALAMWDSDGLDLQDQLTPRYAKWRQGLQPFEELLEDVPESQNRPLRECGSLCFDPPQTTAPQAPAVIAEEATRKILCGCIPATKLGAREEPGSPATMLKL